MTDYGNFEYESYQDLHTIQKFLESLKNGFEQGKITLHSGNDEICLEPMNLLKFNLRAQKKDSKCKLQIKISWKEGAVKSEHAPLTIDTH
jgi:amphi-Trp domain-containing protein